MPRLSPSATVLPASKTEFGDLDGITRDISFPPLSCTITSRMESRIVISINRFGCAPSTTVCATCRGICQSGRPSPYRFTDPPLNCTTGDRWTTTQAPEVRGSDLPRVIARRIVASHVSVVDIVLLTRGYARYCCLHVGARSNIGSPTGITVVTMRRLP
jgi:hypothetical protein